MVTAVFAVAALAASAVATPAREATRRPVMTLVSENPVSVAGRGFARSERVTLRTAVNGAQYRKTLRASRTGRFTATFAGANAECQPFAVSAVGAAGSRTTLRRITIPPPCGIPIQP